MADLSKTVYEEYKASNHTDHTHLWQKNITYDCDATKTPMCAKPESEEKWQKYLPNNTSKDNIPVQFSVIPCPFLGRPDRTGIMNFREIDYENMKEMRNLSSVVIVTGIRNDH